MADTKASEFVAFAQSVGVTVEQSSELYRLTSFRIGGRAKFYVEVGTIDQLRALFQWPHWATLRPKLIGGGSNLLISSAEYDGVVLRLSDDFARVSVDAQHRYTIGAAARSALTSKRISKAGYEGLEFLSTIPGSVGGAVIQNAGCYGGELFDFIHTVTWFDGQIVQQAKADQIDHGYRYTQFLHSQNIVLEIQLKPLPEPAPGGSPEHAAILDKLEDCHNRRRSSQPKNKKSAGSIFKNPVQGPKAWELIDACGLRGRTKGGAKISDEHTNFIVNTGQATSEDVYYLIRTMEEQVEAKHGVLLHREVELIGLFDGSYAVNAG